MSNADKQNQNTMKWSFYQIWNNSLEQGRPDKPLKKRTNMWASELGGSYIDRYLKMNAVPVSNPYNPRSLRKFEAGNIWEAIIGYVLKRAGILINQQEWLSYQYLGLSEVTGKLDFLAGGNPDYDKAIALINKEFDWLPEFISRATQNIILGLKEKYPNGLEKVILEIKSCSSFSFERYEKTNTADKKHKLQAFHYLKAKNMPEAHIVYICKDDARMLEMGILNPSYVEDEYKKDITAMSNFIQNNQEPPKETIIVFDGNFSINWHVSYSNYLTMLYGYANQMEVEEKFKPMIMRWNRVLERIKDEKEMTDNNKEAIQEMEANGFKLEEIKKQICGN